MILPIQLRAARALLNWTQADLARAAGVAEVSVKNIESGATNPRATTIDALERTLEGAGVIFVRENGEGPGVRLRRAAHRGRLRVQAYKAAPGYYVRFEPTGYGPTSDIGGFTTEAEAEAWVADRRGLADRALNEALVLLSRLRSAPDSALTEVWYLLREVEPAHLPEGPGQDHLGEALMWLTSRASCDAPEAFSGSTEEDLNWLRERLARAISGPF